MKTIFGLCGAILLIGTFWIWRATRQPTSFGEFTGAMTVPVAELIDHPKAFLGRPVAAEGVISEQCQTMGCYFFFRSGTKTLRVDLKEVAMNAPIREGRQARVEGQMIPFNDGYQLFASAVEFE